MREIPNRGEIQLDVAAGDLLLEWVHHLLDESDGVLGKALLALALILLDLHPLDLVLVVKPHGLPRLLNGLEDLHGLLVFHFHLLREIFVRTLFQEVIE
jgi:hypothetical protein